MRGHNAVNAHFSSRGPIFFSSVFIYADLKKQKLDFTQACHFVGRVDLTPPCRKAAYPMHYLERDDI